MMNEKKNVFTQIYLWSQKHIFFWRLAQGKLNVFFWSLDQNSTEYVSIRQPKKFSSSFFFLQQQLFLLNICLFTRNVHFEKDIIVDRFQSSKSYISQKPFLSNILISAPAATFFFRWQTFTHLLLSPILNIFYVEDTEKDRFFFCPYRKQNVYHYSTRFNVISKTVTQEFRRTDQKTILDNWKEAWVNSNCLTR